MTCKKCRATFEVLIGALEEIDSSTAVGPLKTRAEIEVQAQKLIELEEFKDAKNQM